MMRLLAVITCLLLLSACAYKSVEKDFDRDKAHDSAIAAAIGYLKAEQLERAVYHAESALGYSPDSAMAYHVLALIYQKQKDYQRSVQMFKTSLKNDPDFSQARNNYGLLLIELKKYSEAIEQLNMAASDLNYRNRASSLSSIGNAYDLLGDEITAVSHWQKALNINGQLPVPAYKLSKFFLNQSNYLQAYKYYKIFENYGQQSEETAFVGLEIAIGANDKQAITYYEQLWRGLK